jgi:hypothetical protein
LSRLLGRLIIGLRSDHSVTVAARVLASGGPSLHPNSLKAKLGFIIANHARP